MDYEDLYAEIRSVLDSLSAVLPDTDRISCVQLLDHGEAQEAMDVLIATVVKLNLPVTHEQRDRLGALTAEFDLSAEGRATWRYLSDPEMLDRMTAVDETPS